MTNRTHRLLVQRGATYGRKRSMRFSRANTYKRRTSCLSSGGQATSLRGLSAGRLIHSFPMRRSSIRLLHTILAFHTFVIEAGTKGVDLTKLTDYVHDSRLNFIAIKRLKPQPWFDTNRRSRVRGLLLTEPHSIAEQRTITDGRIIPGV